MSITEYDEEGCPQCGSELDWLYICYRCGECYEPNPWRTTYWNVLSATQSEQAKADTSLGNAFVVIMLWIKRILKSKQKQ